MTIESDIADLKDANNALTAAAQQLVDEVPPAAASAAQVAAQVVIDTAQTSLDAKVTAAAGSATAAATSASNAASTLASAAKSSDLIDTTDAAKGSGRLGFNIVLEYAAGTLGNYIRSLVSGLSDISGAGTIGANPSGAAMTVQDELDLSSIDLLKKIPKSQWAAIANRISTYDCTAALVAAIATGKRVTVSMPGRYRFTTAYVGTSDFDVEATCPGVEFDFTTNATAICMKNSGSVTRLPDLDVASPIVQGRCTATFQSAPAVQPGQWVCFFNPTPSSYLNWVSRAYYKAGEWKQVLSVSGNVVTFAQPFVASYTAASLNVYSLTSVKSRLANVTLLGGTGTKQLVIFSLCADAVFDRVSASGANYASYGLDRCIRCNIYDPQIRNTGSGSDDYGLVLGNCQHINSFGGNIYGRRHAVAIGGADAVCAVPYRDIRIYDAILSNDPTLDNGAADFHGIGEDSSFERCKVYGGVRFGGGDQNYCIECDVYAPAEHVVGWLAYWAEVKGGRSGFLRCMLSTTRNPRSVTPTSQAMLSINISGSSAITADTVLPFSPVVQDCTVYGRNLGSDTRFMWFINRGTTQQFNPVLDNIHFDVDGMESILTSGLVSGTAASKGIIIDRIYGVPDGTILHNLANNAYRDFPHRCQRQDGTWSGTSVADNKIVASAIPFKLRYPRAPRESFSIGGAGGAAFNNLGGQPPSVSANAKTAISITPQVTTPASMTAGQNFDVSWAVDMREC